MKTSASPIKSALEEVDALRQLFRATLKHFGDSVETDLDRLKEEIAAREPGKKAAISPELVRELRDVTTLLRMLDIKPEKGRRRDLKKVEKTIEEALELVQHWPRKS